MEIRLAKTNIRKQVGGGLLSSILPLVKTFGPALATTLGLAALAGTASEGASLEVRKMSSGDRQQPKVFSVLYKILSVVVDYKHNLTAKQKRDIFNALQTGIDFTIQPTAKQVGSGLGTILASIGIPMILSAFTGKRRWRGSDRRSNTSNGSVPATTIHW